MAKPKVQFFNIYDRGGTLRSMADEAARMNDESRSRFVRRAIAIENNVQPRPNAGKGIQLFCGGGNGEKSSNLLGASQMAARFPSLYGFQLPAPTDCLGSWGGWKFRSRFSENGLVPDGTTVVPSSSSLTVPRLVKVGTPTDCRGSWGKWKEVGSALPCSGKFARTHGLPGKLGRVEVAQKVGVNPHLLFSSRIAGEVWAVEAGFLKSTKLVVLTHGLLGKFGQWKFRSRFSENGLVPVGTFSVPSSTSSLVPIVKKVGTPTDCLGCWGSGSFRL